MRAEGWNRIPLIRMTNISIHARRKAARLRTTDRRHRRRHLTWRPTVPGRLTTNATTSSSAARSAGRSKNGKRVRMLKNPSYSGITTEFWNSMDAICSRDEWTLWGTPNCGKGQPQQVMGTGHGASPARFTEYQGGDGLQGQLSVLPSRWNGALLNADQTTKPQTFSRS